MRPILLLLIVLASNSWAFSLVSAHTESKPDSVHVESGAVQVNGTIQSGAVTTQPGTITVTGTVEKGAFPKPLVSAPVSVPITTTVSEGAFTVKEGAVTVKEGAVQLNVQPRGFSLNIDPGAIVIRVDASLLGSKETKSVEEVARSLKEVYENQYSLLLKAGGVCAAVLFSAILLSWYLHRKNTKS